MTVHGGGRGIYVELEEYGNSVKLSKFLERGGSWMERVYRESNGTKRIPPAPFTVRPENPEETLQSFFDANKRNATPFYVEYGQNFEPRRASRIDGIHNFRLLLYLISMSKLSKKDFNSVRVHSRNLFHDCENCEIRSDKVYPIFYKH